MTGSGTQVHSRTRELSVAAVILNWNQAAVTIEAVACVRSQVDHVYVVDNGSPAADVSRLRRLEDVDVTLVPNAANLGYASGCNRGVDAALSAGYDAIFILNNDAFPAPGCVDLLECRLRDAPFVAALGPTVLHHGTGEVLHTACALDPRLGRARWLQRGTPISELSDRPVPTDYLSGEAMLVRSEVVREIGMFDSRFFCYYEDVDWGIRARRAGWNLEVVPNAFVEHMVGTTSEGLVGIYYRARNLPLFLRVSFGHSRLGAFLLSIPGEVISFGSLIRHRRLRLATRGVVRGWFVGVGMRV